MFKNLFNKENKSPQKTNEEEVTKEKLVEEPGKATSLFERLKAGLNKTRKGMTEKIDAVLKAYRKIDDELFDELEEVLVTADVGINTTMEIIDRLRDKVRRIKFQSLRK